MVRKSLFIIPAVALASYVSYSYLKEPATVENNNLAILQDYLQAHPEPITLNPEMHEPLSYEEAQLVWQNLSDQEKISLVKKILKQQTKDKLNSFKHWTSENLDELLDFGDDTK